MTLVQGRVFSADPHPDISSTLPQPEKKVGQLTKVVLNHFVVPTSIVGEHFVLGRSVSSHPCSSRTLDATARWPLRKGHGVTFSS